MNLKNYQTLAGWEKTGAHHCREWSKWPAVGRNPTALGVAQTGVERCGGGASEAAAQVRLLDGARGAAARAAAARWSDGAGLARRRGQTGAAALAEWRDGGA